MCHIQTFPMSQRKTTSKCKLSMKVKMKRRQLNVQNSIRKNLRKMRETEETPKKVLEEKQTNQKETKS